VTKLDSDVGRDYVLLLLFTGLRRREAAALRWDQVDLKNKILRLGASDVKAKRDLELPTSDFVHDLLSRRRRIGDTRWVFPATSRSGHVEEPRYYLDLVAEDCGVQVSAHDLRRTFVTVAEGTEMSSFALKALVNHSLGNGDVTAGYVQMSAERLRAPAQRVCDRLRELCGVRRK
jgi:integrase